MEKMQTCNISNNLTSNDSIRNYYQNLMKLDKLKIFDIVQLSISINSPRIKITNRKADQIKRLIIKNPFEKIKDILDLK